MYFDNNKHIDAYFRKGLKDYSSVPDDAVWENIEHQLTEEKKVRQLFFSKVAAGLLIFIGLATFLALEFSYFSDVEKEFASLNFNQELKSSIINDEVDKYSGKNYNENQLIASDVSIPRGMLFDQNIQSQIVTEEKKSLQEQESLSKMKALNVTLLENKTKQSEFIELRNQTFFNTSKIPPREFSFQDNYRLPTKRQKENIFSLSGSFSPIMSYRNTKMTTSNSAVSSEKSMLSYSGGMNVGYSIGDRLTLRTGIQYAKFGQSLNGVEVSSDSYAMDGET